MLKTTVLLENLKNGISFAHHAVSSRSPLPILLNFLLEAKDGALTVSATDLEIGIRAKIPAKVEEEGAITVSAKTFLDLVSSIDQEKIELEEKEGKLFLRASGLKTQLPTINAAEFPKLYEEKGQKQASFATDQLTKDLSKIVFAAASDVSRPALSGVLIKKENKGISLVATDGYRLSLKKESSLGEVAKGSRDALLIPARVIKELLGVKSENKEASLFINSSSSQALFEIGDIEIVGRLIEAEYPDYQKIIPEDATTISSFDRIEAQSAVRTCSVFAREAANIVKMGIGKDKIVFSASASSVGENEVEIDAKTSGEENEIAFNARYLLELLSNIDDEVVSFEMTGPLNPGVFKTEGDKSFLHLIMPIRIQ